MISHKPPRPPRDYGIPVGEPHGPFHGKLVNYGDGWHAGVGIIDGDEVTHTQYTHKPLPSFGDALRAAEREAMQMWEATQASDFAAACLREVDE